MNQPQNVWPKLNTTRKSKGIDFELKADKSKLTEQKIAKL